MVSTQGRRQVFRAGGPGRVARRVQYGKGAVPFPQKFFLTFSCKMVHSAQSEGLHEQCAAYVTNAVLLKAVRM